MAFKQRETSQKTRDWPCWQSIAYTIKSSRRIVKMVTLHYHRILQQQLLETTHFTQAVTKAVRAISECPDEASFTCRLPHHPHHRRRHLLGHPHPLQSHYHPFPVSRQNSKKKMR